MINKISQKFRKTLETFQEKLPRSFGRKYQKFLKNLQEDPDEVHRTFRRTSRGLPLYLSHVVQFSPEAPRELPTSSDGTS